MSQPQKHPKPVIVRETPHGFTIELDLDEARRAGGRIHPKLADYGRHAAAIYTPEGTTGFVDACVADVERASAASPVRLMHVTEVARLDKLVTNIIYDVLGLRDAKTKPVNWYVRFHLLNPPARAPGRAAPPARIRRRWR